MSDNFRKSDKKLFSNKRLLYIFGSLCIAYIGVDIEFGNQRSKTVALLLEISLLVLWSDEGVDAEKGFNLVGCRVELQEAFSLETDQLPGLRHQPAGLMFRQFTLMEGN